jgi:NRPS condensation-like uncharacterized protein
MEAGIPATFRAEFMDWIVELMVESKIIGAQMGAAVRFGVRLDEARVAHVLRLLLDAEPVLGSRFVVDGVPEWERLEDLGSRALLEVVPSLDHESDAAAYVAAGLDSREGPQVGAVILRGAEGDTLVLKTTHVALDGGALKQLLYLFGSFYRAVGADPDFAPDADSRPRSLVSLAKTAGFVERLKALRFRRHFPRTDWSVPGLGGHGRPLYLADEIAPADFGPLVVFGKERGATVHDLLLAAYYRALFAELRPAPGSRTPVSMSADLRPWLSKDAVMALANLPATWAVMVTPVEKEEDFSGTLARVVERTREWKAADVGRTRAVESVLGERLVRLLGWGTLRRHWATITRTLEGTGYPSLTNIGEIDSAALDFGAGAPIEDAYLFGPVGYPGGLIVTVSTFRRRLRLSAGIDALSTDTRLARRVLDGTVAELRAVVRGTAGQSSPSPGDSGTLTG